MLNLRGLLILISTVLCSSFLLAQNCNFKVSGFVKDIKSQEAIANASVYGKEQSAGSITNQQGFFEIESLCAGDLHLLVSHIGCSPLSVYLRLKRDTTLILWLDHNNELLDEVAVGAEGETKDLSFKKALNASNIEENAGADLASVLENLNGLASIGNGAKISKPIVQGLYGNRISIVNNGVVHGGQQWGNDHAPEIDPLMAGRLSVLKGAAAVEYMGSSLGAVVLVDPKPLSDDPHIHGALQYFFESNGRGSVLNTRLEQKNAWFKWRFAGSLKKNGDQKTADYYLRNTGREEANALIQLEKRYLNRWQTKLYYSFNASELGLLRGSQIGNLSDLELALNREVPFFTEEDFSFQIAAPRQEVQHQLAKLSQLLSLSKNKGLEFNYAWQLNQRREFDLRRAERSKDPALSLEQHNHFWELKYFQSEAEKASFQAGLQYNLVDNVNIPETGILPLVPDYISRNAGAYFRLQREWANWQVDWGARADYIIQNVAAISMTTPREVLRYRNRFFNPKSSFALSYQANESINLSVNTGFAQRNPAINELYSNGLHQGLSGIEEGEANLKAEQSFKTSFNVLYQPTKNWSFEMLTFIQSINNFIYLQPQDELRLTIRGAFPVFRYQQNDALLRGLEFQSIYDPAGAWSFKLNYSYLRGDNVEQGIPLVFMPPNRLYGEINYQLGQWGSWEKLEFQLNNRLVFEQKHWLIGQDFLAPPPLYNLLGTKLSAERQIGKNRCHIFIKGDNLFNIAYRDYLNRQRYFADDLGINISVGLGLKF